jgi:hypothetical protein
MNNNSPHVSLDDAPHCSGVSEMWVVNAWERDGMGAPQFDNIGEQ